MPLVADNDSEASRDWHSIRLHSETFREAVQDHRASGVSVLRFRGLEVTSDLV
jgi:hypothetical protein